MNDSANLTTVANGDIVFRSAENEEETTPSGGYRYSYYLTNQTYSGTLSGDLCLKHYSTDEIVDSQVWDDSLDGDEYVCIGYLYDRADDITVAAGGHLGVGKGASVSGVVLKSGGSVTVRSSGQCGNIEYAGGSIAVEGNLILNGLTFSSQDATFLTPYNDDRTYYDVNDWGGTVRITGTASLTNCSFLNNNGAVAAGGYNRDGFGSDDSSNMTVSNCYFGQNTETRWGNGGAISGIHLTVIDSTFESNQSNRSGGAIDGAGTISGSSFSNNSVVATIISGGGAISCRFDTRLKNNVFTRNSGRFGGAVINYSDAQLQVESCDFYSNTAEIGGGALSNCISLLWIYGTPSVTVSDCLFSGNQSSNYGGALENESNMTVVDSLFASNGANYYGGAVSNQRTTGIGGSVYESSIDISGSTFNRNNSNYGGAIYNQSHFTGTSLTITNNRASYGGGISNEKGADFSLSNSDLLSNLALYGGAVYNSGVNSTWSGITFEWNSASTGGAVYNKQSAQMTITDSFFYDNCASEGGGAVYNASGATITISNCSFLTSSDSICNLGNMVWEGRISLAGNVETYETIDASGAKVVFNLKNRQPSEGILFNNLRLLNCSDLSISLSSKQIGETFMLGGNVVIQTESDPKAYVNADGTFLFGGFTTALNSPITVTQDGVAIGQFVWNRAAGMYGSFIYNAVRYSLGISSDLNLYLKTERVTEVEYEFTEIGQTVYYNGEKPDGCTLEGVLMAIPYTADITVTFDKNLANGLYEFTTSVAEVPGSVNQFQLQVSGAGDDPALTGVSYISHDMCIPGILVAETDSPVTYKFTNVEDYVLTDHILGTMTLEAGADDSTSMDGVQTNTQERQICFDFGRRPDVNKSWWWNKALFAGDLRTGVSVSLVVTRNKSWLTNKEYYSAVITKGDQQYTTSDCIVTRCYDEYNNNFTIQILGSDMSPEMEYNVIVVYCDIDNKEYSMSFGTNNLVSNTNLTIDGPDLFFAPEDRLHCWIATACNMMYACGYLDFDAQKCYRILNMRYYRDNNNKTSLGNATRVFKDFLYEKLGIAYDDQDICTSFGEKSLDELKNNYPQVIDRGLTHLASTNGVICGAIYYVRPGEANHVITCYGADVISDHEVVLTCVDSDDNETKTNNITFKKDDDGLWFFERNQKKNYIYRIETLISRDIYNDIKLTESNIVRMPLTANSNEIYAVQCAGCSEDDHGVIVSEYLYDSTIMNGGYLLVASGANAKKMVVNTGGTVIFNSGSIAKGTIRTTGGVLTVESGVDVSEGEFDFAVSRMGEGNSVRLLNDLHNVSGAKLTITIVNGQTAGKYVLAGGASDFAGTLSVVGEYNYMNDVGEGFDDGFIGELGLDNTLYIEDRTYSLILEEDDLVLVISAEKESPLGIVGDFNGDGRAMLVTESDSMFAVYSDGAAWGGLVLDPGWHVAGVGDFNGDGTDDFLRVNDEGYVVGEMSNGNGIFAPQVLNFLSEGWNILGTGDFNGNGTDDVLIANPTAASETVGLLGYWESGATWTLINGYSAEWECVATGDFNGDGKCDMLWRNWFEGEGGGTYNAYCTWIVEDPVDWRMVSVANPGEWNFLCAGDFDGDKMNDIAMINDEGVVGIWGVNDGWLSSWSILSAVTPEWQLAGVGDFNADGTDDIAWCSTTTSQVGCWQIENKELASWSNVAFLS